MPLIPNFEIGLFNAWLLVIPLWLSSWIILMTADKQVAKRIMDMSWCTPRDKMAGGVSMIIYYGLIIYSIGVPLMPLNSTWFIIGMVIFILGTFPFLIACCNFATTPSNELVVKGVYKISRNPMYFFTTVALLGVSIASASFVMILLLGSYNAFQHFFALGEERCCLEIYGESYRKYMQKVSRYFLV